MSKVIVDLPSGRRVRVSVLLPEAGGAFPREWKRIAHAAPHTARSRPIAVIDRGYNFHGSLAEEYYLVQDAAVDPQNLVLWQGDTGSQDDDDQARIYPVAYCHFESLCDEERGDLSEKVAAAALLYAYLRTCAEVWEGHYSEDDQASGSELLDDDTVSGILANALSGEPLSCAALSEEPGPLAPQPAPPRKATPPGRSPKRAKGRPRKGE
jgi:hypothetical protein